MASQQRSLVSHSDFQNIAVGDLEAYRQSLQRIAVRIREELGHHPEAPNQWVKLSQLREAIHKPAVPTHENSTERKRKRGVEKLRLADPHEVAGTRRSKSRQPTSLTTPAITPVGEFKRASGAPIRSPRRSSRLQGFAISPPASATFKQETTARQRAYADHSAPTLA